MGEKRIGIEIRVLANLIGRCLNEVGFNDEQNSLTGPQGLVLGYLYDHQDYDIFQKDIEATFNVRRSSATGLLKSLETNGFIERVSVVYDARLKKIILTEKAYEFKESLEKCIQKMEAILVKDLEPQEIEDLIRIMNKIKNNLK
ncbi:MarR family winged helix-turn-helix transcriptional regulator [Thomasclavelia cocleata]|uniref:MarR family winged helix-turn-helix transcriptional regulator n=1 Tax=Thomasclavelia cocleata TaxID=69824 RepID=UPI0024327176|nr:MarR family transcriptional regulator [Thomasclavelia cocleata]